MAATHSTAVAQTSTSNTAGSTTTGSWIDLTAVYSSTIYALITNGGTGPTVGCSVRVDLSTDNGTTIYQGVLGTYLAGTANSTTYWFAFSLPPDTMYARVVFTGNTGQAVTVQADIVKLTGL